MTHPCRIVTSTVKVNQGVEHVVSVKTESDIPKDKIFECIQELKDCVVEAPVSINDIILENVAGTHVNVIATKIIERKEDPHG